MKEKTKKHLKEEEWHVKRGKEEEEAASLYALETRHRKNPYSWCLHALGKAFDSSQQPHRLSSCAWWPFSDTKTSERAMMVTLEMSPNPG